MNVFECEVNNDVSRANHKEHLVNLLRIAGKFDDALVGGEPSENGKNRTLSRPGSFLNRLILFCKRR